MARAHTDALIVLSTFVFAFIIDQVKSFLSLSVIYFVIVRRFGFLKENEKEFVLQENLAVKVENCVPKTQAILLKMLESSVFETASLINIGLYTVFILQDLTLADSFNFPPKIIESIDRVFLWIFAVEIFLKTFASNGTYLADKFNAFDAAIVFISVAFNMKGLKAKGLGVLRLLRVVVITIRKITGNTSKLRH